MKPDHRRALLALLSRAQPKPEFAPLSLWRESVIQFVNTYIIEERKRRPPNPRELALMVEEMNQVEECERADERLRIARQAYGGPLPGESPS